MRRAADVIAGLLDRGDRGWVTAADRAGADALVYGALAQHGWVAGQPLMHPVPTCPYCSVGTPHDWDGRLICDECQTVLDATSVQIWPFRAEAFVRWFSTEAGLSGGGRAVAPGVWQFGTYRADGVPWECFYRGIAPLSATASQRVAAYRNALVVCGHAVHIGDPTVPGRHVLLADVLTDLPLRVRPLCEVLSPTGPVRFERHCGRLWAGSACLGEVPAGSKEYYLLARLAAEADHFVQYADLKQFVQREARCADQTDEATFCQRLKSRIKKHWVPEIDSVLATTNKADGYRLRATVVLGPAGRVLGG